MKKRISVLALALSVGLPSVAPASVRVPERLVGTWVSSDGRSTELTYRFRRDGTYPHIAVLVQERATGVASFARAATGRVTVQGNRLVLHPRRGNEELIDPDVPSASYKRPVAAALTFASHGAAPRGGGARRPGPVRCRSMASGRRTLRLRSCHGPRGGGR
jgi:hypothetical protein